LFGEIRQTHEEDFINIISEETCLKNKFKFAKTNHSNVLMQRCVLMSYDLNLCKICGCCYS